MASAVHQPVREGPHLVALTALDGVAAVVVVLIFWVTRLLEAPLPPFEFVLGWVLAGLCAAAMMLRWRSPMVATVVVLIATVAGVTLELSADPLFGVAWTIYPLAVEHGFRRGWVRLSLFLFVIAFAVLASVPTRLDPVASYLLLSLAVVACSWTLGSGTGERVEIAARAAQEHAERMAVERQLEAAREIHDVVANTLGTIGVEAAVAAHVERSSKAELRVSLNEIASASRDALAQVRQVVASLRAGEAAALRAAPTLAELDALFHRARAAGTPVTTQISGTEGLNDVEQMTVFRIIQEALTNVVRHAPGSPCYIDVRCAGDWLMITIDDDGPGMNSTTPPRGHGIVGMQERAEFMGGTCAVVARKQGGLRVRAELPFFRAAQLDERSRPGVQL
jgi:signal transduction histidine kinase